MHTIYASEICLTKKRKIFQLPLDCAEQLYDSRKHCKRKEGIYRLKSKLLRNKKKEYIWDEKKLMN